VEFRVVTILNVKDAAAYVKHSVPTLNRLRVNGGGPIYSKPAGRVVYDTDDLDQWIEGGKRRSTADARTRRNRPRVSGRTAVARAAVSIRPENGRS
jgi:helix-turn-helix protein